MLIKMYYDKNYKIIQFKKINWVFLKLHKEYNIFSTTIFDSKLLQQYTKSFLILERIEILVYRLNISQNWRVHSIFSIAQLKFFDAFATNSFKRTLFSSNSVVVENDTKTIKSFEIKKIVTIKIANREKQFLIRWLNYDSEHDQWRNLSEMNNVINFVNEFELFHFESKFDVEFAFRRRDRFVKVKASNKPI